MSALVDKTCRDTIYLTPPYILAAVREFFGGPIGLDPATEADNPTAAQHFYTERDNGLQLPWIGYGPVFVNPPYGKQLMEWVERICFAGRYTPSYSKDPLIALLPGQRFETKVWQERLLPHRNLDLIVFLRGRVKFLRPNGGVAKSNPYGSMLYVFNAGNRNHAPLARLGYVLVK